MSLVWDTQDQKILVAVNVLLMMKKCLLIMMAFSVISGSTVKCINKVSMGKYNKLSLNPRCIMFYCCEYHLKVIIKLLNLLITSCVGRQIEFDKWL